MSTVAFSIDRVEVRPFEVPFRQPLFLRDGVLRTRSGWLLGLGSGRETGWGEASPLPGFSVENASEAGRALERLSTRLEGTPCDGSDPLGTAESLLESEAVPASVRFALELALVHLAAAVSERPPQELLAVPARPACDIAALLVVGPDGDAETRAAELSDRGYRAVKMKVGRGPVDRDASLVCRVAARLGDAVALRLDANRAWSMPDALRFADATAGVRIDFIEEPLADPDGLAAFAAKTGLPVALDESIPGTEPEDLEVFEGLSAVVLKPTLTGGLGIALRFARRCRDLGLRVVVSSSFESGVGLAGLAALSAAVPGGGEPAGLGTAGLLDRDVVVPPFPSDRVVVPVPVPFRVTLDRPTPP